MLPLTILFSDDFRLLSSQQLFKGLSHYRVSDDRVLTDTWKALKVKTSIPLPANEGLASIDLPLDLPLTMEAANRRFSRYLTLCEKPIPTCIIVNPAQLHPRYEPLKRSHIRDGVCQRLYALALTAREHKHELILQPPNEDTLELTLDILAETLNKPGLMHWGRLGTGTAHQQQVCSADTWLAGAPGARTCN